MNGTSKKVWQLLKLVLPMHKIMFLRATKIAAAVATVDFKFPIAAAAVATVDFKFPIAAAAVVNSNSSRGIDFKSPVAK
ncbi:hypothetical protein H5410_052633 [Solanum commersonii]|uniref:Uncharacterized protein n=1 Tax=Solanum commersonii TaxID=4109 RepID=A0A9J5X458_SOLCO|nr:hypothetical protein H5410_052633 [Solanum commersonii]